LAGPFVAFLERGVVARHVNLVQNVDVSDRLAVGQHFAAVIVVLEGHRVRLALYPVVQVVLQVERVSSGTQHRVGRRVKLHPLPFFF